MLAATSVMLPGPPWVLGWLVMGTHLKPMYRLDILLQARIDQFMLFYRREPFECR